MASRFAGSLCVWRFAPSRAWTVAVFGAFALTAQAPQPQPTTLPVIGGTHAKGFCTIVRENVATTVAGLMKNDELIGAGHRAVLKTAHDAAASAQSRAGADAAKPQLDMDTIYLNRVVASMAHNLVVVKKLLSDEKRFPKKPVTDDERFAAMMRAQLQDAADRQTVALNHLSGMLETQSIGKGLNDLDHNLAGSLSVAGAKSGVTTPSSSDQFLGATTLPGSGPGGNFEHTTGIGAGPARGQTIWDKLALDIEVQQTRIAAAEQTLTPTVVAAATACKDQTGATPAP